MNDKPLNHEVIAVFSEALKRSGIAAQEAFVASQCGDNAEMYEEVMELIKAQRDAGSFLADDDGSHERFLETSDHLPTTLSRSDAKEGERIGNYKLLQQIGEGGFGVVFMADQLKPVNRRVAVKVIKRGMDTKEVVARFEAERQALALMDHPNIARVLDGGETESGRPYFVMELVKGVPLTEFCDSNKLAIRERVELFETICRAVEHAHKKGVIHRDLKPSNVMVTIHDNTPMPKIIDFGVSKAISQRLTEKTLFTAYGQMIGTPTYMSPEQAKLSTHDIDTRSDVYSLGVLLYELLTGSTPLDKTKVRELGFAEMQRLIAEEEPPKPSTRLSTMGVQSGSIAIDRKTESKTLQTLLRGDLDWIVMKALEKERTRRYQSASSFADDIQRFLDNDVIEARPPSTTYKLQKFVRRNRAAVLTAAALLTLLSLGLLGTTLGLFEAQRQTKEAKKQTSLAKIASKEATVERDRARDAEQVAILAKNSAEESRLREEAIARRQRRELYAANMQLADQLYNSQNGEQKRIEQLLAAWIPIDDQEDLREFSWRYQWTRLYKNGAITVPECVGVAITPENKMVVANYNGLQEVDQGGEKRELIKWKLDKPYSYFSPDGRWVAVRFASGIELYNIQRREKVLSLPQTRCSFSANGKYFAAWKGSVDVDSLSLDEDAIPVWKLHGENPVSIEPLDIGPVKELPNYGSYLKIGSDGKSFLLEDSPGVVRDLQIGAFLNGNREPVIWEHRNKPSCAWSPDGRIIATTVGGIVELRLTTDVSGNTIPDKLRFSTHGKTISIIRFSLDGKLLATGGRDGTIDLWDVSEFAAAAGRFESQARENSGGIDWNESLFLSVNKPRLIRTIKAYTNPVTGFDSALNFSVDGTQLVSLATPRPGVAKLWNLNREQGKYAMARVAKDQFGWEVPLKERGAAVLGEFLIDQIPASEIVQGQVEKGERITAIFDPRSDDWKNLDSVETSILESWRDYTVLSQGPLGSAVRMKLENSDGESHEVTVRRHGRPRQQDPRSFSVAFAPDGNSVLVAGTTLGATQLNLTSNQAKRYPDRGLSVAYSPDGRLMAIDSFFGISIRDTESDKELYRLDSVPDAKLHINKLAGNLAFSPDGKFLAHVSGFRSNTGRSDLNVWRTSDFTKIGGGPLHEENFAMLSIVFSPDSSLLLVGDYKGRVQMWKTSDWKLKSLLVTQQRGIGALAISSNGKLLFVGSRSKTNGTTRGISIWDMETENQLRRLGSRKKVGFLALSPDDRTLAAGSSDHNVVLWDVETGKRLQMIQGHSRMVNGVAFSKDGNRLATADGDAIVRIWDAASTDAIEKDPNTLLAMARLGLLRAEQQRHKEAGALFSKVIELNRETQHLSEKQVSEMRDNQAKALDLHALSLERLGRWDEALESRKELVRLEPDEHLFQYRVASAYLFRREHEKFWQVWQKMFDRWRDTDSQKAKRNAKLRLLFFNAPDHELQTAFKIADRAYETRDNTPVDFVNFAVLAKGMAEYRRGNFVDALTHLEDARKSFEEDPRFIGNGSMCQYFAAMAHHRLGDSKAARAAFDDARERQHQSTSDLQKSMNDYFWLDWQQTEVVRREAVALIGIDESQLDPSNPDSSN